MLKNKYLFRGFGYELLVVGGDVKCDFAERCTGKLSLMLTGG
jgi:hypothetical protein